MVQHPSVQARLWHAAVPNGTVFIASAAIMVLELVAGRLVATYLGMSLYTWTTIIGVMMGGIALGNYLGGLLADRVPLLRALGVLFIASALGALTILPLNDALGQWQALWRLAWPARILSHVSLAFLGPAVLLGMITPLVAKLALQLRPAAGRAVGGVFAFGVLGSIVGTFSTGYYLLMVFGVREIVVACAILLGLLGLPYLMASRSWVIPAVRAGGGAIAAARPRAGVMFWPILTVFASNAAFMMFELSASRVLSRTFGASLYTWTAVIGIVLAGISLGNYLGGRIADRNPSRENIATAFLLASIGVLCAPRIAQVMAYMFDFSAYFSGFSWPMQITLYMAAAFFLPNVFLGMISPLVAKRCLEQGVSGGRAVGDIYAWGAVGAIAGTFLAGYFLIQVLWPLPLIGLIAAGLAALAVAYAPRAPLALIWLVLAVGASATALLPWGPFQHAARVVGLALPQDPRVVYEDESNYSYIAVLQNLDYPNHREFLLDRLTHSYVDLENPTLLKYEYERVYEAVLDKFYPNQEPISGFVIGGGGYAFPRYLELTRPGSHVEVAEIDPAVTEAAHAAFGLPRDTGIHIFNMDARNHVADLIERQRQGGDITLFDCIFGDSINDYTVPFHLTTLEFTRQVDQLLTDDGIYMLNLIDMLDSGAFLAAVINTCREVFPFVYAFDTGRVSYVRDTFVVVASRRALNLLDVPERIRRQHPDYVGRLIDPQTLDALLGRHRHMVLTDNFAPVENLLTPVVRSRQKEPGSVLFVRAQNYAAQGQIRRALADAQAALRYKAAWPEVHEFIAGLYAQEGDHESAIAALRLALEHHPRPAVGHFNLGALLQNQGRNEEALAEFVRAAGIEPLYWDAQVEAAKVALLLGQADVSLRHWEHAVAIAPDDPNANYNLGLAHAQLRQYAEAVTRWERVISLKPDHEAALHNLLLAYTGGGNFDAAWDTVRRQRQLGLEPEPALLETLKQRSGRRE